MLGNLPVKAPVSLSQMLACREKILITKKTSSGDTRIESKINKHRMTTKVADRGGRVTESEGPQKESFAQQDAQRNMPQWSKRSEPPPGDYRGRGGRGSGRGRGRGGGGRGGGGFYNSGNDGNRGGFRGGFKRGNFTS